MSIKIIKELYFTLNDKKDLFLLLNDIDIGNNYICYKELTEYGHDIQICEKTGEIIYQMLLCRDFEPELKGRYITTFYNNKTKKGLLEKIHSNRTEYYLDDKYISTNIDDEIIKLIKINTKNILKKKKYPTLYKFIINDTVNEDIILIPKDELIDL
jgi:hypothetical protein